MNKKYWPTPYKQPVNELRISKEEIADMRKTVKEKTERMWQEVIKENPYYQRLEEIGDNIRAGRVRSKKTIKRVTGRNRRRTRAERVRMKEGKKRIGEAKRQIMRF